MEPAKLIKTTTVLPVTDLYATIAWYERVLGMQTIYIHGEGRRGEEENYANYAILTRDGVEVHFILDEGEPGAPCNLLAEPSLLEVGDDDHRVT